MTSVQDSGHLEVNRNASILTSRSSIVCRLTVHVSQQDCHFLTNEEPEPIKTKINTHDPTSWSYYLFQHYAVELLVCDHYFTPTP